MHRPDGRLVPVLLGILLLKRPGRASVATSEEDLDSAYPIEILMRCQVLGDFLSNEESVSQEETPSKTFTARTPTGLVKLSFCFFPYFPLLMSGKT